MDPTIIIKFLEAILANPQVDAVIKEIIDDALAQINNHLQGSLQEPKP